MKHREREADLRVDRHHGVGLVLILVAKGDAQGPGEVVPKRHLFAQAAACARILQRKVRSFERGGCVWHNHQDSIGWRHARPRAWGGWMRVRVRKREGSRTRASRRSGGDARLGRLACHMPGGYSACHLRSLRRLSLLDSRSCSCLSSPTTSNPPKTMRALPCSFQEPPPRLLSQPPSTNPTNIPPFVVFSPSPFETRGQEGTVLGSEGGLYVRRMRSTVRKESKTRNTTRILVDSTVVWGG